MLPKPIDFGIQPKGVGTVELIRKAAKRASYEFQVSTDPGSEANWKRLHSGTRGRIVKGGLVSGTRYYFRATTIDKNGMSPWSPVLSTIVL